MDVPAGGHGEFRRRAERRLEAYANYGWTVEPFGAAPDAV